MTQVLNISTKALYEQENQLHNCRYDKTTY